MGKLTDSQTGKARQGGERQTGEDGSVKTLEDPSHQHPFLGVLAASGREIVVWHGTDVLIDSDEDSI